jgi:hypothetical protein
MLQFNTDSWHYRLVLYVFGKNFFTEQDTLDFDECEKTGTLVWIRKPKVVNFCPYCRGVLWSTLSLPFVYVWRLFPHKKKTLTHEETMKRLIRRGNIMKSLGGAIQFPLAALRIMDGDYVTAAVQIIFGVTLILMFISPGSDRTPIVYKYLGPPMKKYLGPSISVILKFISKHWPKKKQMAKKEIIKPKSPSLLMTYLETNHSKICPPVAFVDPNDTKVRV